MVGTLRGITISGFRGAAGIPITDGVVGMDLIGLMARTIGAMADIGDTPNITAAIRCMVNPETPLELIIPLTWADRELQAIVGAAAPPIS